MIIHHIKPAKVISIIKGITSLPVYLVRPGFQDAIMVRDYKRRQVSAHFSDLRMRLNAIRKNTILPGEIRVYPFPVDYFY